MLAEIDFGHGCLLVFAGGSNGIVLIGIEVPILYEIGAGLSGWVINSGVIDKSTSRFESIRGQSDPVFAAAHARRKFFDLHEAGNHPVARDALARIARLYVAEEETRGMDTQGHMQHRALHSLPQLQDMHQWRAGPRQEELVVRR